MKTPDFYTRRTLALMYFPKSPARQTVRRLTEWIHRCRSFTAVLGRRNGGRPLRLPKLLQYV
ncbi:MAG: DUF4248 domain-containing protein [Clostridium sp.]|nr:DUF4248 domain-containing protein [Clostridium sp.]